MEVGNEVPKSQIAGGRKLKVLPDDGHRGEPIIFCDADTLQAVFGFRTRI
jgi:hypothetical protein